MATLLSDDFNRANNVSVVGAPQIGPTPTVLSGVAGISTNQLYFPTVPSNVSWALGTPNVEITMTNPNTLNATGVSILLGIVDTNNYWQVHFNTVGVSLIQTVGGLVASQYTSTVRLPATTLSVCKAHYRDGIIRAYVDGTLVLRWALPVPITANNHGVRSSIANRYLDSILAVDAPTIAEPTTTGETLESAIAADFHLDPGFLYRGRDLKTQDAAAGA